MYQRRSQRRLNPNRQHLSRAFSSKFVLTLLACLLLTVCASASDKNIVSRFIIAVPGGVPPVGGHSVTLSWTPAVATGTQVIAYNIYRGAASGAESATPSNATPISCTSVATCTFADTTVLGGLTYYYYAESVDTTTNTPSVPSAEAINSTTHQPFAAVPLAPPTNAHAVSQ